jgi:hypothetical protein
VEHGLLREVARILEGRHYTTYYGRTSIAFLDQYDAPLQAKIGQDFFDPLKRVIQDMNPDLDSDDISQLVDDNLASIRDFYSRLISWIEANYPHLYKSKIDLDMLMRLFGHYSFFHKELYETSEEIASLIDLDEIMSYEPYELE